MNGKLKFDEPIRFAMQSSGQQKSDQQFDMTCPCGSTFSVPLDVVGNSVPCPKCGNYVTISNEDFMPFTCGCGKSLRIPRAGGAKKCPACRNLIKLLITLSAPPKPEKPVVIDSGRTEEARPNTHQTVQKPQDDYIKVKCQCGKKFSLPATRAHHSIECPQCHNKFKLSDKHFIHINCPCGTELRVLRSLEGKKFKCPKCGQRQKVLETLNLNLAS